MSALTSCGHSPILACDENCLRRVGILKEQEVRDKEEAHKKSLAEKLKRSNPPDSQGIAVLKVLLPAMNKDDLILAIRLCANYLEARS